MDYLKHLKLYCTECNYPFEIIYDSNEWIDPEHCPACGEHETLEYQHNKDVSYQE